MEQKPQKIKYILIQIKNIEKSLLSEINKKDEIEKRVENILDKTSKLCEFSNKLNIQYHRFIKEEKILNEKLDERNIFSNSRNEEYSYNDLKQEEQITRSEIEKNSNELNILMNIKEKEIENLDNKLKKLEQCNNISLHKINELVNIMKH